MSSKKNKIRDYVVNIMNTLDPSKTNGKRYTKFFDDMSETKFKDYMTKLKNGETQLYIIIPNMKLSMKMDDIHKAIEMTGAKVFQKLRIKDQSTGKTYLTENEYPVLSLPIKRMQQIADKKLSVSPSDGKTDAMTGALLDSEKSSGISYPEIQILYAQGLIETLYELIKVRGGDIASYSEFKRQLEETGRVEIGRISGDSATRSVVMTDVLLKAMHYNSNFSDVIKGVSIK